MNKLIYRFEIICHGCLRGEFPEQARRGAKRSHLNHRRAGADRPDRPARDDDGGQAIRGIVGGYAITPESTYLDVVCHRPTPSIRQCSADTGHSPTGFEAATLAYLQGELDMTVSPDVGGRTTVGGGPFTPEG